MKKFGFFRSINCVSSNQSYDIEKRLDPADVFPDEIMLNIFKDLNFQDILHANAVSKSWHRLSNDVQILSPFLEGLERVADQSNQAEVNRDGKDIKRTLLVSKLEKRKRVLEAEMDDLRNFNPRPYRAVRAPNYPSVGPLASMAGLVYLIDPICHGIGTFFKDIAKNKDIKKKQNELVILGQKIDEYQNGEVILRK
ncbi:MAG: F-box protein [Gammaproteobacteria bacterium]|nr:F-box protein [Gammaproteobacteria bacterium]